MRKTIITYLLITLFSAGYMNIASAQNKLKKIMDGNSVLVARTFYADTLLIFCDTVYVLNKPTFKVYESAYDKVRTGNTNVNNLVASYDNLIKKQEEIINQKEEYYQDLKSKFDSLVGKSNVFISTSTTNISQISNSLGRATENLVETQKLLTDSQKLLEEERKTSWKRTLKIGVGGFSFGVVITAIIFLVKK